MKNKIKYKSLDKQSDLIYFPHLRSSQRLLKYRQKEKLLSENEQINYFIKTSSSSNSYINNLKTQCKKKLCRRQNKFTKNTYFTEQ